MPREDPNSDRTFNVVFTDEFALVGKKDTYGDPGVHRHFGPCYSSRYGRLLGFIIRSLDYAPGTKTADAECK